MSDKFNELMSANQKASDKYDAIQSQHQEVSHAYDNAISPKEKEKLRAQMNSLEAKLRQADQEEKRTKSKLDTYMSTKS